MVIFTLILFLFAFIKPCLAQDITINCFKSGYCQQTTEVPFFDETNIFPGYNIKHNLTIKNSRKENCTLSFLAKTNETIPPLSQKIQISIKNGNDIWFYGNLYDLLLNGNNSNYLPLGQIFQNSTGIYQWAAVLNDDSGNEYQNTSVIFDIDFNFICDKKIIVTDPINYENITPNCNNSKPGPVTNLNIIEAPSGYTLNWIHPTTPHTNYFIGYGFEPNIYVFDKKTNSNNNYYTISNLTHGAQYCFYIRTINGCMYGNQITEKCINLGSTIPVFTQPSSGFESTILGVSITRPDTNTSIIVNLKNIIINSIYKAINIAKSFLKYFQFLWN
ncbi:MAG: fibronectin type III domain-containing protein [Candidatus Shapirobacteria bacterium]|jgi:hypothetical protein